MFQQAFQGSKNHFSLGSRITADGDCSHEITRHLLFGRKAMTNLDSVLKSRDITLPTKICIVKAMVFPVVMYGCESWAIKKAEHRRIYAFKRWCWRRLLRFPWTAAHQASLSFAISLSLLKLMSIESVMPSNHLILCCPLLLLPSIFPSIRAFSSEVALHIRSPKYRSFSTSTSNEYSG